MDQGKVQAEIVGDGDGLFDAALVRTHDHAVLPVRDVVLDPLAKQRFHLNKNKDIRTVPCRVFFCCSFLFTRTASQGMSKNPSSCGVCGSSIMMWAAPAFLIMSATSLEAMGTRFPSFWSPLLQSE